MSKTNTFENDLLLLLFNNTNIANIGDATGVRGSTAAGSFYLSLHTANPDETGDQTTSECNYTGYARLAVARSGAGFTVSGNAVNLAATQSFGARSDAASQTATHWGLGTASSGAGKLMYKGAISPTIVITQGVIPQLGTGTQITED